MVRSCRGPHLDPNAHPAQTVNPSQPSQITPLVVRSPALCVRMLCVVHIAQRQTRGVHESQLTEGTPCHRLRSTMITIGWPQAQDSFRSAHWHYLCHRQPFLATGESQMLLQLYTNCAHAGM